MLAGCGNEKLNLQEEISVVKQDPTIIYATIQSEPGEMHEEVIDVSFHSIKTNDTPAKKLFTLTPNQSFIDSNSVFKFCSDSQKMYQESSRLIKKSPYQDAFIREIDLSGNIRDLTFTGTSTSQYKDWEHYRKGFALSPDCKKIIWSNSYYQITNHKETGAANEITVASIDGANKKILLDLQKNKSNTSKDVQGWPKESADSIYLSNYYWDRNGRGGGLLSLNTETGELITLKNIQSNQSIWAISDDMSLVAHSLNPLFGESQNASITNLKSGTTYTLPDTGNGKRIFSPDKTKLASTKHNCNVLGAEGMCIPSLYVFDYLNEDSTLSNGVEIAANFKLLAWLDDNTILGKRDNSLITIDLHANKETTLVTTEDKLLFIGIIK
jgi:hypothetical protein